MENVNVIYPKLLIILLVLIYVLLDLLLMDKKYNVLMIFVKLQIAKLAIILKKFAKNA
jgi:hypothetical protein